jgi:hypothetical protein
MENKKIFSMKAVLYGLLILETTQLHALQQVAQRPRSPLVEAPDVNTNIVIEVPIAMPVKQDLNGARRIFCTASKRFVPVAACIFATVFLGAIAYNMHMLGM